MMNTEITFCPHCGRENPRNYKFCAECGFELPKLNLSDSRRYPKEQSEYSNPQNIQHNDQTKITIIQPKSYGIAILLTFIFGPLGLFYSSVIGGLTMTFMPIILYIILVLQGQSELVLDLLMIAVLPPIGPLFIGAYWLICIVWAAISVALFNKNTRVNYTKKSSAVNTIIGVFIFLFLWFLFVLGLVYYKDNKDKNSFNRKDSNYYFKQQKEEASNSINTTKPNQDQIINYLLSQIKSKDFTLEGRYVRVEDNSPFAPFLEVNFGEKMCRVRYIFMNVACEYTIDKNYVYIKFGEPGKQPPLIMQIIDNKTLEGEGLANGTFKKQ